VLALALARRRLGQGVKRGTVFGEALKEGRQSFVRREGRRRASRKAHGQNWARAGSGGRLRAGASGESNSESQRVGGSLGFEHALLAATIGPRLRAHAAQP